MVMATTPESNLYLECMFGTGVHPPGRSTSIMIYGDDGWYYFDGGVFALCIKIDTTISTL